MKRRESWSLDSQGGAWEAESTSDGEKWRRLDEAAREAKAVGRMFGQRDKRT